MTKHNASYTEDFSDYISEGLLSDCCTAQFNEDSGICLKCGEHCEAIES